MSMMSRNRKAPAAGIMAVLLLFAAIPLAAQIPEPVSNAKNASAGVLGNDVDNFMNYFGFGSAVFDNWFGYAGYQNTAEADSVDGSNSRFSLGFARRLSRFYLGAWYNGNVAGLSSNSLDGEDSSSLYAVNQIQFLFGFRRFALKFGFQEELEMADYTGPKVDDKDKIQKDYDESVLRGYFAGDIGAGLPISIGDLTLKLSLDARVFFCLDSVENVSEASGTTTRWGEHGDYIRPEANLALNLDIPGNYNDVFTPGVSYAFSAGFYNNKYDVNGIRGNVKGKVEWGKTSTIIGNYYSANISVSENSLGIFGLTHIITPRFSYSGNPSGLLKWGILTKVPVLISYDSYNSYEESTTVISGLQNVDVQRVQSKTTDISNLVVTPELDLGVSFQVIPGRLTLNTGLIVAFKYYNYVETVEPGYSDTSTGWANDVSVHNSGWDFTSPLGVRAGFTLNFNPRFMLDAYFNPLEPSATKEAAVDVIRFSLLFSLKG
jgi:hypothetical protein